MSYEAYRNIFIGGLAVSLLFLTASIIMFIKFKIPYLLGYFSKKNRTKSVAAIQKETDDYIKNQQNHDGFNYVSDSFSDNLGKLPTGSPKDEDIKTISEDEAGYTLATTMFGKTWDNQLQRSNQSNFVIEREITLIHTDEVIA